MSVRTDLETEFRTAWEDNPTLAPLYVTATERVLDDIRRGTVVIRQKRIDVNPAAPMSHSNVGILVTIVAPQQNTDHAADYLDDIVPEVLAYLEPRYQNDGAECVDYGNRLAYDIPLTIISKRI